MSAAASGSELFPITHSVFHEAITKFSEFDDNELALLDATNRATLPSTSPSKFVLDLNLRPDLRDAIGDDAELARQAYRTGALLGRRAIKESIEVIDDSGMAAITDLNKQVILDVVAQGKEYIPDCERNLHGYIDRKLSKVDPVFGFYPYLDPGDEIENGLLRQAWTRAGSSFMTPDAVDKRIDDEIPKGLKDVFRVFALLESDPDKNWEPVVPGELVEYRGTARE